MTGRLSDREIFLKAIDLTGDARRAFLDEACGDDVELRHRVERLLEVDARPSEASTTPYVSEPSTTPMPHSSDDSTSLRDAIGLRPGDVVDGFKILETLGEGGMGVVYLAEQQFPVKRRIALKVIKPGMDSKQVLARFEAERQALAMMDHPGIARVLQAGTTDRGLPFFAMEYVKGEPITTAADRVMLDTKQRLELMIAVCEAVQHAHHKGIIHRDLKPSNILVTTDSNDRPIVKIIDFGVAKATNQSLTEHTVYTQVGHFIGTPAYMSPEQADLTAADIDTRTDIYSLGVILYELLTGQLPFDPKELREVGLEEMRRRIREDDPPKPSTRLTKVDDATATRISKTRRTRIDQLQRSLASELDWIPLKALRKLRSERYSTPTDMGQDIQRYLDGEPLEAGPESTSYRLKKFVKKRRVPIAVGSVLAVTLVTAAVVSVLALRVARESERELQVTNKSLESAKDELDEQLDQANQERNGREEALRELSKFIGSMKVERIQRLIDDGRFQEARTEIGALNSDELPAGFGFVRSGIRLDEPSRDSDLGNLPFHAEWVDRGVAWGEGRDSLTRMVRNGGGAWEEEGRFETDGRFDVSPNGRWIAVVPKGGDRIVIHDVTRNEPEREIRPIRRRLEQIFISDDGQHVWTVDAASDDVWVHSGDSARSRRVIPRDMESASRVAVDRGRGWVAVEDLRRERILIYDSLAARGSVSECHEIRDLPIDPTLAFCSEGLLVADAQGVTLHDPTGVAESRFTRHDFPVVPSIEVDPKGGWAVAAGAGVQVVYRIGAGGLEATGAAWGTWALNEWRDQGPAIHEWRWSAAGEEAGWSRIDFDGSIRRSPGVRAGAPARCFASCSWTGSAGIEVTFTGRGTDGIPRRFREDFVARSSKVPTWNDRGGFAVLVGPSDDDQWGTAPCVWWASDARDVGTVIREPDDLDVGSREGIMMRISDDGGVLVWSYPSDMEDVHTRIRINSPVREETWKTLSLRKAFEGRDADPRILDFVLSRNGRYLAIKADGGWQVAVVDLHADELELEFHSIRRLTGEGLIDVRLDFRDQPASMAVSDDGRLLVATSRDPSLELLLIDLDAWTVCGSLNLVERDFLDPEIAISEDRRTIEVVDPGSSETGRGPRTLVWTDASARAGRGR